MTDKKKMTAERLSDGRVRLRGTVWSDEFPESDRARWIHFYRDMHDRYHAASYKDAADALEALGPITEPASQTGA